MADPRFFSVAGPFTLKHLAEISRAQIGGDSDPDALFSDVAPLVSAGSDDVAFLDNRRYLDAFTTTKAGACLVHPDLAPKAPRGMALLVTPEPYHGYARIAGAFYPAPRPEAAVAPSAVIDDTAVLGEDCRVDAGAVIGAGARIGRRCHIGANAVIGDAVVLGDDCVVGSGASLVFCVVGARVVIHAGVRVGEDGFGFAPGRQEHLKVPQLGRVRIEDDVEIGANTTIDRAMLTRTEIGERAKFDNLIQVAHGCTIGPDVVVAAQSGFSGSTRVGRGAIVMAQVGVAGHLEIGSRAFLGARAGVHKDVADHAQVYGTPQMEGRAWHRADPLRSASSCLERPGTPRGRCGGDR